METIHACRMYGSLNGVRTFYLAIISKFAKPTKVTTKQTLYMVC